MGILYNQLERFANNISSNLNKLNERLTALANGAISEQKEIDWQDGWINVSGNIRSSTASCFALVPMEAGETIVIGTRNTNITIIGSTTADSVAVGDNVTIIQKTSSSDAFETYTYTCTDAINLVICVRASEYTLDFHQTAPFYSDIDGLSDRIEVIEPKVNTLEETAYKTVTPSLELGSMDTNYGTNVSSTTAMRTPDFISVGATVLTFQNCKVSIYAYQNDGTFVGGYSATDGWTKSWSKYTRLTSPVYLSNLNENKYQLRLRFDTFTGDVTAENANASLQVSRIDELESESEKIEVYTVGTGKDFATFTEMLVSLKGDTKQKTVYVYPGMYDIFEEMGGAEWMQTVDTSANWRNVNNIVPPNTEIIGIGDVVLAWNPTDAEIIDSAHAFLLSPLNLSGSCKIKNLKIHCSNARYGIHDETSGNSEFDGTVHEFENVEVIYTASTYGVKYAYGAGHNRNCKYKFKNCLFSAAYGAVWSIHDWPATQYETSQFEFDNCRFLDNRNSQPANIRFSSSDTVGRLDDVKINGCVFNSISFSTEGSADVKQGYKVTTMLCKVYVPSYTSHILEADRIAPEDYLVIPS